MNVHTSTCSGSLVLSNVAASRHSQKLNAGEYRNHNLEAWTDVQLSATYWVDAGSTRVQSNITFWCAFKKVVLVHGSFNGLATQGNICCIAALPALLYSVANVHKHRSLTDCMDVSTDKLDSKAHSRPPTRHVL